MIPHPDLKPEMILQELAARGEHLPKRITGPPETHAERVEAYERLKKLAEDPNNIRILCIACEQDVPILESAACACGGFVCLRCQHLEEDGVCDHMPIPDAAPDQEWDDD